MSSIPTGPLLQSDGKQMEMCLVAVTVSKDISPVWRISVDLDPKSSENQLHEELGRKVHQDLSNLYGGYAGFQSDVAGLEFALKPLCGYLQKFQSSIVCDDRDTEVCLSLNVSATGYRPQVQMQRVLGPINTDPITIITRFQPFPWKSTVDPGNPTAQKSGSKERFHGSWTCSLGGQQVFSNAVSALKLTHHGFSERLDATLDADSNFVDTACILAEWMGKDRRVLRSGSGYHAVQHFLQFTDGGGANVGGYIHVNDTQESQRLVFDRGVSMLMNALARHTRWMKGLTPEDYMATSTPRFEGCFMEQSSLRGPDHVDAQ